MLCQVDRRSSVLSTNGQPLQQPDGDKRDRREPARSFEGRQQANGCGSSAHDAEGKNECDAAADKIAHTAEKQCTKWAHQKTDGKRSEVGNQREGVVTWRIKLDRKNRRKRTEDVEVVPLNHRSSSRTQNNAHQ